MTRSPERHEPLPTPSNGTATAVDPPVTSKAVVPPSPTQSDKSSESEGRPVREKLKETRIDAHTSSELPSSDLPMDDARNGADHAGSHSGDQSISGSDSERGRLRRKRSRERFEADDGQDKKKEHERHVRKKSRDVTSPKPDDAPTSPKPAKDAVEPIDEDDADQTMHSVEGSEPSQPQAPKPDQPSTPEATMIDENAANVVSPKNKRTRDQADIGEAAALNAVADKEAEAVTKVEEPNPKRPRDKSELQPTPDKEASETKVPPGSGFANTSAASPFATLAKSPSPQIAARKPTPELPQTSNDKFKSSGFSSFTSTASPFGGLAKPSSSSPFATGGSAKLTSFASSAPTSKPTGFASLSDGVSKSVFGGGSTTILGGSSGFGGTLGSGSGFGSLGSTKPGNFAAPGVTGITGLSSKPAQPFGAAANNDSDSEEADGDDEDTQGDDNGSEDRQDRRFKAIEVETGEEHEDVVWVGRAKLFTLDREKKQWQERGVGPFKFNITKAEPKKARFIIRADGTHRLLLNAAVTKDMLFGDPAGKVPTDGKASFSAPAADGRGVDMHILRMRTENAQKLYDAVQAYKYSV
ncbi:hypothetical protein BDV96DRAFT_124237 [Lophiotrema nucula]|uniref:RanBD1 domain-containing protein n=1 Tax=Lophiotrema nucula TaxID=690887 RepID=A0A6A5Z2Y6_9PLEO|nr:hypothetical protein BDV96DRAFT_124237 [Lophiotrema nucula]